jgi:hypothetical protein
MNYWYVLPPAAVATGITSLAARAGIFRADARVDRLNQQAEVGEQARKPDAPECGMPQRAATPSAANVSRCGASVMAVPWLPVAAGRDSL